MTGPRQTFTDDDAALLYDVENTWDRVGWPADRFYSDAVAAGTTLRFHTPETLNPALAEAGFRVESQYGDWQHGPLTADSREIITVARAQ